MHFQILSVLTALFCVISFPAIIMAQKTDRVPNLENLKLMKKQAIVEVAINQIHKHTAFSIDTSQFQNIKVLAGESMIIVAFRNPVKYVPYKSAHYYDLSVILPELQFNYSPVVNPPNFKYSKNNITFFKPSSSDETNMRFVEKALEKVMPVPFESDQTGNGLIIREHKKYFEVLVLTGYSETTYQIDRKTGVILSSEHYDLEPDPEEEVLIEIK